MEGTRKDGAASTTSGSFGVSGGGVDGLVADVVRVVNRPDYPAFVGRVRRLGGCSHPVHLTGWSRTRDAGTGAVVSVFRSDQAPGGRVSVACRNRRASRCPACAAVYQADTFQLVRAGMSGGKGVPAAVSGHPMVFATLTAPGFGAVHAHRVGKSGRVLPCHPRRGGGECPHGVPVACMERHGSDDPLVGVPLCGECYDYRSAVVWQASTGKLWERFTIYLPRRLAQLAGRSRADVRASVRLSYVKVAEYQRRGLVHFHAVIRADGADGPGSPPASWVTADLIGRAVSAAAGAVSVVVDGGRAGWWRLAWGEQVDSRPLRLVGAGGDGDVVAAYVAKYATKSTDDVFAPDAAAGGVESPGMLHARRMIATAWALADVPELGGLNLARWANSLGFRGRVSTASRRYSTTLGALRAARVAYAAGVGSQANREQDSAVGTEESLPVLVREASWRVVGFGWSPGEALIAAEVARDVELNRWAAAEATTGAAGGRGWGAGSVVGARHRDGST